MVSGHCGIPGNVLGDLAASAGRQHTSITSIPSARSDAASLGSRVGKDMSAPLWNYAQHHHGQFHNVDPKIEFRTPLELP